MAESTLTLAQQRKDLSSSEDVATRTYWGMVRAKLWADKITVFGIFLIVTMVTIALAAPWIGDNVLGFDPLDTNLRQRSKPPTWAQESWPTFQQFTVTCQGDAGCDWSLWGPIFASSGRGTIATIFLPLVRQENGAP